MLKHWNVLKPKAPYLLISALVLVLDQWSKWWIENRLALFEVQTVIPNFFNLTHVQNTGVAFGMFAAHGDNTGTLVLVALGLAALGFVGLYFYWVPLWDRMLLTALALVVGGAIGNLADRVHQGSVTDFLDFYVGTYHWHTFNVADSAISVGIALMLLSSFRQPPPGIEIEEADAGPSPEDPEPESGDEPPVGPGRDH